MVMTAEIFRQARKLMIKYWRFWWFGLKHWTRSMESHKLARHNFVPDGAIQPSHGPAI